MTISWIKIVLIILGVIGVMAKFAVIDKKREPITVNEALVNMVVQGVYILAIIYA